jgi:hypothetical protein
MLWCAALYSTNALVLNTISQTLSRIDIEAQSSINNFAVLGQYPDAAPNKAVIVDGVIYAVITYENRIQRIDAETGATLGWIELEDSSAPNDIAVYGNRAYVTGSTSNKVYSLDLDLNMQDGELAVGVSPEGMGMFNHYLWVANTGYNLAESAYGPGSVTIIDMQQFELVTTFSTGINPRAIVPVGNEMAVLCTGNYFDVPGEVDFFDATTYAPITVVATGGTPGLGVYDGGHRLFVGNAWPMGVYILDTDAHTVTADPDNSGIEGGNALVIDNGWLAVADAGNYISPSTIRFYGIDDLSEEYAVTTGVGSIDIDFLNPVSVDTPDTRERIAFRVYPNPARDYADIAFSQDLPKSARISLFDVRGRACRTWPAATTLHWDGRDANGHRCAPGIYFVRVDDGQGNTTTRKMTLIR